MPSLVVTETYADGQVLFEADLDNLKASVEDFFNLTKIDSDNLKTEVLARLVPVGTVVMYGAATPPSGWLSCDGTAISRFTFAVLFGVIGETFGPGDGVNTFNLPDFARQIPMGRGGVQVSGPGTDIADQGGSETHTLITGEIPAHTHVSGGSHTHVEAWDQNAGAVAGIGGGGSDGGSLTVLNELTDFATSTLDATGGGG